MLDVAEGNVDLGVEIDGACFWREKAPQSHVAHEVDQTARVFGILQVDFEVSYDEESFGHWFGDAVSQRFKEPTLIRSWGRVS